MSRRVSEETRRASTRLAELRRREATWAVSLKAMNAEGFRRPNGGEWTNTTAWRALKSAALDREVEAKRRRHEGEQ